MPNGLNVESSLLEKKFGKAPISIFAASGNCELPSLYVISSLPPSMSADTISKCLGVYVLKITEIGSHNI